MLSRIIQPDPLGGGMDIHKPKPWHGFREFLKEYLIIVVGVITALAGEQLAEWVHTQKDVAEAREALHTEIAGNGENATFGLEETKCMGEQLDNIEAWTHGGAHAEDMRLSLRSMRSATWDAVKSGAVTHMPLKERLGYAHYYDSIDNMRYAIEKQRDIFRSIAGILKRDRLADEDAGRLIETLAQAQQITRIRADNIDGLIAVAKTIGVEPTPLSEKSKTALTRICGRPFEG